MVQGNGFTTEDTESTEEPGEQYLCVLCVLCGESSRTIFKNPILKVFRVKRILQCVGKDVER